MDARARQRVEQPCRVTRAGTVNPMEDAAAERRKSTFNPDELAAFLHGGEDKLARRWGRELTLGVGLGELAGMHGCAVPAERSCKRCALLLSHAWAVKWGESASK